MEGTRRTRMFAALLVPMIATAGWGTGQRRRLRALSRSTPFRRGIVVMIKTDDFLSYPLKKMDEPTMTNARVSWLNRLALALIWIVITAGIAFLVARNGAADDDVADVIAAAPPIAAEQRSAVTLTERTISPIVSGDGAVVRDGENDRWLLIAPAEPADVAYRLLDDPISVRALIDGGPAGFECAWAGLGLPGGGDADASAQSGAAPLTLGFASLVPIDGSGDQGGSTITGGSTSAGVTMRCEIPDDVRVVTGLTGTMVLTMEEPTEAMALPVTAVIGSEGQGQVVVVGNDGATSVRPVELGRSDIFWIEVTDGLEEGEQVLEFPTQFDFGPGSADVTQDYASSVDSGRSGSQVGPPLRGRARQVSARARRPEPTGHGDYLCCHSFQPVVLKSGSA